MRFFLTIVLFFILSVFIGCSSKKNLSISSIGCPSSEISISNEKMEFNTESWIAECRGNTFYCTRTSFSSVARCKKAVEDQSKVSSSPSSTSKETQKSVRQNNPQSIILPVSGVGNITETRKLILQNTLEDELKNHFRLISQERFEEAQVMAFEELDYEECTEEGAL